MSAASLKPKMDQKGVLIFFVAICSIAAADKEAVEIFKGHGGIHNLPISNGWTVPTSHDVHHIEHVYLPSYAQETTYAYPQEYGYDIDKIALKKSSLIALLSLLPIPKTFIIGLTSGILWVYSNLIMLILGVGLTVVVCSHTTICHISWNPIHHEFRSLATPDRIDAAANFLKKAIKKFKNMQFSTEENEGVRKP